MSDTTRWQRRSRSSRDTDPSPTPTPKPPAPIILGARPAAPQPADHETGSVLSLTQNDQATSASVSSQPDSQHGAGSTAHHRAGSDKPIVVLRSRDDNRNTSVSPSPTPVPTSDSSMPHSSHSHPPSHAPYSTQQRHPSTSQQTAESGKNRLVAPQEMKQSLKIIDENFRWIDAGIDELLDQSQTDYLVVGAIGLQGSGKSSILSMLAGNSAQDPYRNYVFQPQVKETREDAMFQTLGVDMFVSPERIILLDTQPANSSSLLDYVIRQEKKYPQEYTSAENCIEIQSLQIASFLMTVCHVILVTQDWFTDLTFLRSVLTAEMLRPQTLSSFEGSQSNGQDDSPEFHPTVVFLLNKAGQDDFTPETYTDVKLALQSVFRSSKLRCHGAVNMHKDNIISAIKAKEEGYDTDINLFLLPTMEYYKTEPDSILAALPEYRGFPSFNFLLRSLRNQIYSIPRMPMTPSPLSERNWFHFAARTWEAVKKSQLIAEYNRLLP